MVLLSTRAGKKRYGTGGGPLGHFALWIRTRSDDPRDLTTECSWIDLMGDGWEMGGSLGGAVYFYSACLDRELCACSGVDVDVELAVCESF